MWFLEELKIPYELKIYKRDKNFRAPAELKKVHPLGRSPVVEIFPDGDTLAEPIVLAETGYIMSYFLEHYNPDGKLVPQLARDQELVKYYLSYTEGLLQAPLVALLVLSKVLEVAPFGFKMLSAQVAKGVSKAYYLPELTNNLRYLEGQLAKQPGYFAGSKLSAADIILSFPLYDNLFRDPAGGALRIGISALYFDEFPNIAAWAKKIANDEGLIKANKIVDDRLAHL